METLPVGPQTTPQRKPQGESRHPPPIRDAREAGSRVSIGLGFPPNGSSGAAGEDLAGHGKRAVANAGGEEGAGELPAADFAPAEFLELLRGTALDFSMADPLEVTMLRNWAAAFVPGTGMVKGSEELKQRRKRSMAELIAEMDLGMVGFNDDETEAELNQGEDNKGSDLDDGDGGGAAEEGTASGQRERKKSKYLSPPYTNSSPSIKYVDANAILSELLSTAINPFQLKWNRSAKTVRGFFAEFRSSVYSSGSELETCKEHPVGSGGLDGEFVNVEMCDGSKEGKSLRKRNKRKDGANDEARLNLGLDAAEQGKTRQRRKVMKDGADGESPVNLAPVVANGKTALHLGGNKSINSSKGGLLQKRYKRKGAANDGTPADSGCEPIRSSKEGNLGQEMKKNNNEPIGGLQVSSACKVTDGPKGGRSRQKRKIEEALSGSPAALILTFTPGTTLPSKDELISKFSPYGDLIEPKAELLKGCSSARVVFARSSDAEKAFNSPDKRSAFGSPLASCRLRYLPENMPTPSPLQPVKKSPLPYIRKTLARMISMLTGSSSAQKGAGSAGWLQPEGMEGLVGDMKGLREKVDQLMTEPPAAASP